MFDANDFLEKAKATVAVVSTAGLVFGAAIYCWLS